MDQPANSYARLQMPRWELGRLLNREHPDVVPYFSDLVSFKADITSEARQEQKDGWSPRAGNRVPLRVKQTCQRSIPLPLPTQPLRRTTCRREARLRTLHPTFVREPLVTVVNGTSIRIIQVLLDRAIEHGPLYAGFHRHDQINSHPLDWLRRPLKSPISSAT